MKNLFFSFLLVSAALVSQAQTMASNKLPALDKSPMDMIYYPVNYPVLKIQDKATEPLVARVIYSRPQKNGRAVFGELVEYGKIWRLGANEATELELFRDLKLGGKRIPKGKYTLYALVQSNEWTLILNKETDVWGAFKYDEKKDIARLTVPVQKPGTITEAYTMFFEKAPNGLNLNIAWDDVAVVLPFSFK